jgi:molecular chaperone GrpE
MVKIPVKTAKDQEIDAEIPVEEKEVPSEEAVSPGEENLDSVASEAEPAQDEGENAPEISPPVQDNEEAHAEESPPPPEETDEPVGEADELTVLTQQLQTKDREAAEHYEARLRLQAEFNNFKKRKEKESADFRKYANESLLQDILLVVDDFERAIAAAEKTHKLEDFLQGVEMIFSKFLDVLQKKGVKEIEAEPGQAFNPTIHEAVTHMETDEIEEGAIAAVFQKGYYLHDRVLRAPKVGVAKAKG